MRISLMIWPMVALGLVLTLSVPLPAQDPAADANVPETIELTLPPAAEPRPALRYRLMPAPHERTPGNAAVFYYRAMLWLKSQSPEHWKEYDKKSEAWLAAPLDKLPKEEVRQWVSGESFYHQLRIAAYRENCDWDLRVQDLRGTDTVYLLLDDAQQCRTIARRLQLKARLEMSEGRYAEALETLRWGYQLGHDVAQTPLLINGLIGIAITSVMNGELLKLMQVSDANYYWALASLNEPVINMRPAIEYEMNLPYQVFAFLKDAETADRSPDEWRRLIVDCLRILPELESASTGRVPQWQTELLAAGAIAKLYPPAKERLLADGLPRERVEAMSAAQVVAIHTARSVRFAYDEVGKLFYLSPPESIGRSGRVMDRLQQSGLLGSQFSGAEGLPLASLLLPAVSNVKQAGLRLDRERAALMAIEALRMHAAASGKLPAALSDVNVVPVPVNPTTQQPFPYQIDAAGVATFEVPAPAGFPARYYAKRYVIRVRK